MAKSRTLNEIRQSKEYQQAVELSDQGGKYTVPSKGADPVPVKNPFEHEMVGKAVENIVAKLTSGEIFDLIFQAVSDEMSEHYVFDSSEYLTEAGLELFEDEWFDFYHENHGDILYQVMQNLK